MPRDMAPQRQPKCYALAVETGQEWSVRRRLRRAEIIHYLPVQEVLLGRGPDKAHPRRAKCSNPRELPFIPGYVFVWLDLDHDGRECVEGLPGSLKLVRGAAPEPTRIPEPAIALMKALEDEDGLIRLHKAKPKSPFKKGDMVKIEADLEGPYKAWAGLIGKVSEARPNERFGVLLGNSGFDTELPASILVSVAAQ